MAFAKLIDYDGEIDCTFFPKVWGVLRNSLEDGGIYAFKGKVDGSRDTPSLLVDSMEDAKQLENRSIQSVHILVDSNFNAETQISDLKNFLFGEKGNCSLYFHIDAKNNPYVIKANNQLNMSAEEATIEKLKTIPFVKDVWLE
jgi:DNA polymerase-3 subunit alpha